MSVANDDSAMRMLTPVLPELRRALEAVYPVGFGQITLHIEHRVIQRVVFSCSLKRNGLTSPTDSGSIEPDNEM